MKCRLEIDDALPGLIRFRCLACGFKAWLIPGSKNETERMIQETVLEHERYAKGYANPRDPFALSLAEQAKRNERTARPFKGERRTK